LITICDCLLGLPSIMLDRNPMQRERRTLYGMAGEYRKPDHGVEYRTLSNFWLRSPVLADFVAQMAGMCVDVLTTSLGYGDNPESALVKNISFPNLALAIQYNNADMARGVWEAGVKPFIMKWFPSDGPVNASLMPKFEKFLSKDVTEWFPNDPMVEWANYKSASPMWRPFLESISM
jgi:hypothetical protein